MKFSLRILAITVGIFFATTSFSQTTPSTAKDGSTSGAATSSSAKTPSSGAKKSSTPTDKTGAPTTAAGGGDGKVWVNTKSKTYHCEGTKFYGKTKTGEYMTEADAKAKGNHADHGKACAK